MRSNRSAPERISSLHSFRKSERLRSVGTIRVSFDPPPLLVRSILSRCPSVAAEFRKPTGRAIFFVAAGTKDETNRPHPRRTGLGRKRSRRCPGRFSFASDRGKSSRFVSHRIKRNKNFHGGFWRLPNEVLSKCTAPSKQQLPGQF